MGLNLEAHYQGSQVIMAECAKPNKYNEWLMLGVQSRYPMMA